MEKEINVGIGDVIIQQGDTGQGFYILKSGSVEVYKDKLLLSVLVFPGTIFGEMGDILKKPRTCTVKARTACKLVHYDESSIETLITRHPEIALKIIKTLASRLERTTQKLADQFKESPIWSVEPQK